MAERFIFDRRKTLKILGGAAVARLTDAPLAGLHRLVPPPEDGGAWRPRFLAPDEVELVAELAERIVPTTETPGAKAALAHQYIDWQLSLVEPDEVHWFREGLARLDELGRTLYDKPVEALVPDELDVLLGRLASADSKSDPVAATFFEELKGLTVDGYYRSEIGLRQELGYRGNTYLSEFSGCDEEDDSREPEP